MSDWWTQPSTPARASSFHTPSRAHHQLPASSSRARFVNDDPDPSASDGPKFLPAFASSPAGKLALGSSPGGTASPPAPKRSPTARFSSSYAESASSPRHALTRARPVPAPLDDDPIPTSSLHDDVPFRTVSAPVTNTGALSSGSVGGSLSLPQSLEATADTTSLHVYGPPIEHLAALRPYLEQIGPVVSYLPGPDGSNWWTVEYTHALSASYALRRHGEIVNGRWMLAFKVAGPGSTQGLTLVDGVTPTPVNARPGAGTPIQVKSVQILRPKPKAIVSSEDYAWEDPEQPTGFLGRAAEFIFGR